MSNELRLDGRVAIITGAGRGLGRAYARLLASRGAKVVVNDLGADLGGEGQDADPAHQVVEEITGAGGEAVANTASVASEEGARAMVQQALDSFGGLDIIINNAGNFTPKRPFLETTAESFQALWNVHVMGIVNIVRAAWPHLMAQRYGRIVNIGSHCGYHGHEGRFEYAAAKGAIHGLTKSLAMEGRAHGIAVNVLAPGAATRPVLAHHSASFAVDAFAPDLVAPTALWPAHEERTLNGEALGGIAGNTSRIVIAETNGFQSRAPSPEKIRDHLAEIVDIGDTSASNLVFPEGAVERGGELVARFDSASE